MACRQMKNNLKNRLVGAIVANSKKFRNTTRFLFQASEYYNTNIVYKQSFRRKLDSLKLTEGKTIKTNLPEYTDMKYVICILENTTIEDFNLGNV